LESNRKSLEDDGITTEIMDAAINCNLTYVEGAGMIEQGEAQLSPKPLELYLYFSNIYNRSRS